MRISLTYGPRETNGEDEVTGIIITLSRRNLEALTNMLDEGRTAGALTGRDEHVEILVQAQEDDVHYVDREPGRMSWERGDNPDVLMLTKGSLATHVECGTDDLFPTDAA